MHRALVAVLVALLAALVLPVTPVAAATQAKVVVVVGPVGSHNAHYKDDANDIVTEAKRYTSNVTKIFTPNATWAKVKAAAQGANVFVYLGHGNGWPSIYAPFQTQTKDGLGLDPSTGADGTKTVYYGEQYIRDNIRLAPSSVVLLYHLCYASGNTEPGLSQGTFAQAKERVDNYGAGFIGAGARAVFAEGHPSHPAISYMRQLFTTDRSMATIFRTVPTWHDNLYGPYASQRTPGVQYQLDTDTTTPSGFYRSLIGDLSLTASKVTRTAYPNTGAHPADFVLPGAAEVTATEGVPLFATAEAAADPLATSSTTLPLTTRLRLDAEATPALDGTRILRATVLGGSTSGFVRATGIAPRDSAATVFRAFDQSASWLSPNDDGLYDEVVLTPRFSESVDGELRHQERGRHGRQLGQRDRRPHPVRLGPAHGRRLARPRRRLHVGAPGQGRVGQRDGVQDRLVHGRRHAARDEGRARLHRGRERLDRLAGQGHAHRDRQDVRRQVDQLARQRGRRLRVRHGRHAHRERRPRVPVPGRRQGGRPRGVEVDHVQDRHQGARRSPSRTTAPRARPPACSAARSPSSPTFDDASSGVASKTVAVDGGDPQPLTTASFVVDGEGGHTVTFGAKDVAGNAMTKSFTFAIDTVAPELVTPEPAEGEQPRTVTPNGDGVTDTVAIPFSLSEAVDGGRRRSRRPTGPSSARSRRTSPAATARVDWNGRDGAGKALPDGRYTVTLTPTDAAGNAGDPGTPVTVDVYGALAAVARTPAQFFPQDADTLIPSTKATWTMRAPGDGDGRRARRGRRRRAHRVHRQGPPRRRRRVALEREARRRHVRPARPLPDRGPGDERRAAARASPSGCSPTRSSSRRRSRRPSAASR